MALNRDDNWPVKVTQNPNHVLKHFLHHFSLAVKGLVWDGENILKWLKGILYENAYANTNTDRRKSIFDSPFFSSSAEPKKKTIWKGAEKIEDITCLDKVIILCKNNTKNFRRIHSTCYNENYHSVKVRSTKTL